MLRYGSRPTVSTLTTTTEDSAKPSSERRVLRLTLQAGNSGNKEEKTADTAEEQSYAKETWKKKNGLIHRERPAGMESPQQHLGDTTNGVPATSLQHHGPKVYGVVQRTSSDRQQELMAREWTVSHLHDEMKYIREVRDSLEKVRERMYGQFGGMQQSMEKLSQEIRAANSQQRSLESEVKVRTAAMENFDQMNSSLISANISLQKSLLENCQNRVDMKDEVKSLRSTCEKTQEMLRDKERELTASQAENQTLRLQVESSREANNRAMQDLAAKLQREYEEKLQSEQRKHREEIENLQAQLDNYISRLEEAERNLRAAEAKIAERDQRIMEVERLLGCMGMEKSQLQQKLQECEQRMRLLEMTDATDAAAAKKSKQLEEEAVDLRERIKHLNDMVFCQQRKVKGMIEEVESLRSKVAQKDMFISELLDRIAIVECENRPQEILERRDIGVGCDLLPRRLLQTLPDKGKKIKDFAEKVRLAIEERGEEQRRQRLVSAAEAELQSKYRQAFSSQQRAAPLSRLNEENEEAAGDDAQEWDNGPLEKQQDQSLSTAESMETAAEGEPMNSDQIKESELAEALDRVTLSAAEFKEQFNSKATDNYFLQKQPYKKSHYLTVLEKSAAPKRHKFKPNQLPHSNDGSPSGSLSPGRSSGAASPLSAQARKERDRKHLDDITAAKLPPLHHSPVQLLSLDESAALVREHTKKQKELQAKLAAQKLSEGLKISMGSYTPDGGPMAAYREVHDDGAHLSSEED
ncbi:protein GRINL1A isoform 2-T2 [Fundulus diaphanus]